ncbi:tetratricopeptide repeat protein [Candidatus Palauibacter polyketidifaciens]|uniref:tetratricopeptide repeat protein n=1 Tax=Candidatus Palauibacter polyketidifaciens TaxID=3056740 RepID=UPI00238D5A70|nr:tetratricopeptide repeat protein [Candidatus Palauibacter polyketidifaciens]MDE2720763.1 tetratricopeptide repeat protein [Candidatus Palauibacter polyketidifaciens]
MMTNKEGSDASLLEKIRKRRMVQIALVYVGAAWLGVEITDFIVGTYAYSRKVLDTVVFLAILGFPAFLIIGWYHGERGPQRIRRAEAWLLVTLVTLGGIGTYRIATAEPEAGGGAEMAAPPIVAEGVDRSGDAVSFAGSAPDLGPNSLAVLPFRNNVPDPELEWLGSGLADLLTTNLAQLPDLLVVGRQSLYDLITEGGLSEEEEIPESLALTVARGAGARLLLWGSVTGTAGDMRIDAQLIELENGTVASADFARGSDVFELVDTLTVRLASHLSGAPPPAEVARISHLGTRDLEAWAAFHRGNALARAGDLEEAEAHYERAAEIDSTFALPFLTAGGDFRAGEPVSPDGERTEAERRRADWRERGHVQLVRRLPEDVRAQLAGLRGEELRAAIDSLMDGAISGVRLLVTERRSGRGEPQEEPPPRRPPPPPR